MTTPRTRRVLDLIDGAAPERRPGAVVVTTLQDMVQQALAALDEPAPKHAKCGLYLVDPPTVWTLDHEQRNKVAQLVAGIIRYQTRVTRDTFTVAAVVGQRTADEWYDMVMASMWARQEAHALALTGEWRPCALKFETAEVPGTALEDNPDYNPAKDHASFESAEESRLLQRTRRTATVVEKLRIVVVWLEVTGAPPYDKLRQEYNRGDNPQAAFIASRQFAHAPHLVQQQIREAEAIHRRFMLSQYPDGIPEDRLGGMQAVDKYAGREVALPEPRPKKARTARKVGQASADA
jgi:hypothetical protein